MSEANPFQSPDRHVGPASAGSRKADQHYGRGPVFMSLTGLPLGGLVAGLSGAIGAAVLGFIFLAIFPNTAKAPSNEHAERGISSRSEFLFVAAAMGGYSGGAIGVLIGVTLGVVAGVCRARIRDRYVTTATIVSAVLGALIGLLGAVLVRNEALFESTGLTTVLWPATGTIIGGALGGVCGWLLGTLLSRLCWGPPGVSTATLVVRHRRP